MSLCNTLVMWIMTLVLWVAIFLLILANALTWSLSARVGMICISAVAALVYGTVAVCFCRMNSYLRLAKAETVFAQMDYLFKSPPRIVMRIECFHFEEPKEEEKKEKDNKQRVNTSIGRDMVAPVGDNIVIPQPQTAAKQPSRFRLPNRVVTHSVSKDFKFRSWRDVSGTFKLSTPEEEKKKETAAIIEIILSSEVVLANDGTVDDFRTAREDFKDANRKDQFQSYSEAFIVNTFNKSYTILDTESMPLFLRPATLIFWGLLTLYSVYTTIADRYRTTRRLKCRKVISLRQDLYSGELSKRLSQFTPRIVTRTQTAVFSPSGAPQYIPAALDENPAEVSEILVEPPGEECFVPPPPLPVVRLAFPRETESEESRGISWFSMETL